MNYREAIREAAEAAEEAPEELREAAFRTVLERLLEREGGPEKDAPQTPPEAIESDSWEERLLKELPEGHVVQEEGDRGQQTVWAVATLHGRDLEATTEQIRRIIRTELGIAPQNEQNTARTLRKLTPRFLIRRERPDGRGYVYEPTARSVEIFEDR